MSATCPCAAKNLQPAGTQRQPFSLPVRPPRLREVWGNKSVHPAITSTLFFKRSKKTEKTGRLANPNEEPPSKSVSLGSQQPTTPIQSIVGNPRQGKVYCRGTRLLRAGCREVPEEGALSGGLSSHSAFIKKFPVHDPSGSSQGVSLMNPSSGFKLLFP